MMPDRRSLLPESRFARSAVTAVGLALCATLLPTRMASAQLLAAKDGRVVMGHLGLNSTSTAEHNRFWSTLGGVSVSPYNNREMFQFPNVYVSPGHGGNPSGGTIGTTVDHVGFRVSNLREVLSRMAAVGYPQLAPSGGLEPHRDAAFLMGPDGIRVELVEGSLAPHAIAVDHVHFVGPDAAAMRDWYVKALGAAPGNRNGVLSAELPGVSLLFQSSDQNVVGTAGRVLDHVTFEVKNLAAYCDQLQASGFKLERPYSFVKTLNLGVAFLRDPWGTSIELTEGYDKISTEAAPGTGR